MIVKDRPRFLKPLLCSRGSAVLVAVTILFIILSVLFYYYFPRSKWKKEAPPASFEITLNERSEPPVFKVSEETPFKVSREEDSRIAAAIAAGDFTRASILLRASLKDSPDSPELKKVLAGVLNRIALDEYNQGNFRRAKELLDEAIGMEREPSYLENRAYVLIKLDDIKGAAEELEASGRAGADPGIKRLLKSLFTRLGNRSYSKNDMRAAADFYEKGLIYDPEDEGLRSAVRKLKSEGAIEARMDKADGSHFLVKFEGGENAVAGHLIGLLLEEAYYKVGSDLGYYPEDRIEALLYSKEDFRAATHSTWAGAIYDGRIKVPAGGITEKTSELEKAMFHEYTHAVVHRLSGGRAPAWLNEGLAQYEEGKDAGPYKDLLKEFAGSNNGILRSLEGSFMGLNQNDARRAYLLSLSATGYIIKEFGVLSVKKILEGLGRGESLDGAISSALFVSYDELEASWLSSLRR